MARHLYNITASDGHTYRVQAVDDAQAQRMSDFIESRIMAGDAELTGGTAPDNGIVNPPDSVSPVEANSSAGGAAIRGFGQGGYLNWLDEMSAAGNAVNLSELMARSGGPGAPVAHLANLMNRWFPDTLESSHQQTAADAGGFGAAYQHNMRDYAEQARADQEQHPTASSLGEVSGVIANILATRGAGGALAARVLPRAAIPAAMRAEAAMIGAPIRTAAVRGAVQGGAIGGLSGAGAGEGNRWQSGAIGTLAGAGGGLLLDTGVSALVPAIRRYAGAVFGRMPHEEAMRQIITSLRRDGFDLTRPSAIQDLRTELASFGGRPVSLADIGAATRARAGVGLRSPSNVQQQSIDQVLARSQGSGIRLRRDITSNVAPRTDVHALNEDLVAQRSSEAERLRQAALFEGGPSHEVVGQLPSSGLLPANVGSDGKMYVSGPTHFNAAELFPSGVTAADMGFVTPQGQFLSREQALQHLSDSGVSVRPSSNMPGQLDALDYRAQVPAAAQSDQQLMQTITNPEALPAIPSGGMQTRVIDDPVLSQLMQHPDMRRALPGAIARSRSELELLRAQGLPTDHLDAGVFNPEQFQSLMESGVGPLDMRTLDMMKRYLDDEVSALYTRGQGRTFVAGEAHQVRALRDAVRGRMREVVPEYGQYLDQYSGSSDMINALNAGRDYRRLDPEVIAAEQAGRSTAAQELYRVGAARDLTDTVAATTDARNPATRILNSDEARAQADALGLQPGAADRLNTAVSQERQMNLLPAETGNSATDARAAARADAEIGPNVPYISANPINWAGAGLRWAANHFGTQRMAGINAELLPRVLETDHAAMNAIIDDLANFSTRDLNATLRRQRRGSRASRGFGAAIGAPVALPQYPEEQ